MADNAPDGQKKENSRTSEGDYMPHLRTDAHP